MAGILDEVLEGIGEKPEPDEKPAETTSQETKPAEEKKADSNAMHGYSKEFDERYSKRKPA